MLFRGRASELLRAVREGRLLRYERCELGGDPEVVVRVPVTPRSVASGRDRATLEPKTMTAPEVNWSAFYAALHGYVAARVRSASDADDLVHLILERAMGKSVGVEIFNAPGWLFGIARNAVADHYRAQARALLTEAEALHASTPLGSTDEERREVLGCMEPLLATLPPETARLLRWCDMEDRSMSSIAGELGITLSAAKSRVQRARKEFVRVTRECCAITVDARGRVTELTPKNKSAAVDCASSDTCCEAEPRKTS